MIRADSACQRNVANCGYDSKVDEPYGPYKKRLKILTRAMLSWFGKRFRFKAALTLAALYAFCILAPHAAFAFADAAAAAHCLNESRGHVHQQDAAVKHQHAAATVHVHADGTTHEHSKSSAPQDDANADGKGPPANCCGLFCVTGLANAMPPLLAAPVLSAVVEPSADQGLSSTLRILGG